MPRTSRDALRVRKRFPVGAFLCVLGAWAVVAMLGVVAVNALSGNPQLEVFDLSYAYAGMLLAFAWSLYWLPTVVASIAGPWRFVLDGMTLTYGSRTIPLCDVAGIVHDAGWAATRLVITGQRSLRIRWPLWHDHPLWAAILNEATFDRLLNEALNDLRAGRTVSFGKRLALDTHNVHLGRRRIPLASVTDIHVVATRQQLFDSREMIVATASRRHRVNERTILNAHVFVEIVGLLNR